MDSLGCTTYQVYRTPYRLYRIVYKLQTIICTTIAYRLQEFLTVRTFITVNFSGLNMQQVTGLVNQQNMLQAVFFVLRQSLKKSFCLFLASKVLRIFFKLSFTGCFSLIRVSSLMEDNVMAKLLLMEESLTFFTL